jgi:hypothetical protein
MIFSMIFLRLIKKMIATGVFHPLSGDRAHGGRRGPSAEWVQGGGREMAVERACTAPTRMNLLPD